MKKPDVQVTVGATAYAVGLNPARANDDQIPCTYYRQAVNKSGTKVVWKVAAEGHWHLRYGMMRSPFTDVVDDALDKALWRFLREHGR